LFASILKPWNGEPQNAGFPIDLFVNFPQDELDEGWRVAMASLAELYSYAYLGRAFWLWHDTAFYEKVYPQPVLEISDSSEFQPDMELNVGKGTYTYWMKFENDKVTADRLMEELQRTLANVFGYRATIETREMPVWKVIADGNAEKKLKTQGGGRYQSDGNIVLGFTVRNFPPVELIALLTDNLTNDERIPFINETKINGNVDFSIDANMTSLTEVRHAIKKYGLDIVPGKRQMRVLVIRDP
jgi:hypothetical protein